jgi:RHS repeat-associated protein
LCWLLPRQTIVKDLERDVVGLKHLAYGNGIEAYYQRSKEGSLAGIVYRDTRLPLSPELGSTTLEALLGVRPALAAQTPAAADGAERPQLPGALGLPPDPQALLDHRYLWDVQGNLLHTRDKDAASSYAYDARDRLISAATGPIASFARYHYDGNGNRLLAQEGLADQSDIRGNTVKTSYPQQGDRWQTQAGDAGLEEALYDVEGRPERTGHRSFVWDALGKLSEVRDGPQVLARFHYNHRGERMEKTAGSAQTYYLYEDRKLVAELDGNGTLRRQYVYLAEQPVAVIDARISMTDSTNGAAPRGFTAVVANLWRTWFGESETIAYLHSNHLGATEMATDASGKPIWQATYSPFGKLMPTVAQRTTTVDAPAFELNLRLPGQYADKETGLYYNDHRYYDPTRGRYLTPDPLGMDGGANSYAYVNNNPLKYIDPQGLILFAFDGTGNSETPPATDSISNVRKFLAAYDPNLNGRAYYITGIGTTNKDMQYEGSIYTGDGFDERVALAFRFLNEFINTDDGTNIVNIDVIGFSRGATEARAWINQLIGKTKNGTYTVDNKGHCINLRFEGLWDTVSHIVKVFGSESDYDFRIPVQVKYAVQAVALNEHRGGVTHFNGRSIFNAPSTPNTANRIEIGFVGSHSDIGGGYGTGDLSDAALIWMIQQAKSQGIKFKDRTIVDAGWTKITNPILHDRSRNNTQRLGDPPSADEREFIYGNGKSVNQADATVGGNNTAWARGFVSYYRTTCGKSGNEAVGQVDMVRYSAWLSSQGVSMGYSGLSPTPLCN